MPIVRTPFATPINDRDAAHTTTDVRYLNCYPEVVSNPAVPYQKRYYVRRRAGVSSGTTYPLTAPVRKYYNAFGTTYIADRVGVFSVELSAYILTFNTPGTGLVGITVCSSENQQLFICDGSDGWYFTRGQTQAVQINPKVWTANTAYSVGQRVAPVTYNGYHYQCTIAGTSSSSAPTWPTTVGNTVTDGGVTWTCIAYVAFPSARPQIGTWIANLAVSLGQIISTGSSLYAVCTVAGTSGSSTPTWGTAIAQTITDGTVTWTMIAASSVPNGHVPKPITINGFTFLVNSVGQIVNSQSGDIATWPALYYIAGSAYNEKAVWIEKQISNLAVFTGNTVEYMYVSNTNAQGSPLTRIQPTTTLLGLLSQTSIANKDGVAYFIASSGTGGVHIARTDNMSTSPVSVEWVNRILEAEGTTLTTAIGSIFRVDGHYFYLLSLLGQQRTLVYDINEHYWSEWTYQNSNWPFKTYSDDSALDVVMFNGTDTTQYLLKSSNLQDVNAPINVVIQTPLIDGGNQLRKYCSRITLIGDIPQGYGPTYINVNYSDNDYGNWNTNAKALQLNSYRPTYTRLGSFRRRAFKFTYTALAPLRLESFELELGGDTENDQSG